MQLIDGDSIPPFSGIPAKKIVFSKRELQKAPPKLCTIGEFDAIYILEFQAGVCNFVASWRLNQANFKKKIVKNGS